MKKIYILLLFKIIFTVSFLNSQSINIEKLELNDINESRYESTDGLPLIFNLNIKFLNISLNILFKRNNRLDFKNDNGLKAYESHLIRTKNYLIGDYETINCVLSKSNKSKNLNNESSARSSNNLINYFELNLDIVKRIKQNVSTNKYILNELISIKKRMNNQNYYATKTILYGLEQDNSIMNNKSEMIKKRSVKMTTYQKYDLIIKTCIHIDHSFYLDTKKILNTDNDDYIRMYLRMEFAQINLSLNKIYESFDDPLFSLSTEINEFIIHKTKIEALNYSNSNTFFYSINSFINNYYINNRSMCDHVFFVNNYVFKNEESILGLASVSLICNYRTSHIRYSYIKEITMAHELAHNLGSEHDDRNVASQFDCKYQEKHLMYPVALSDSIGYLASECTILQIKKNLFQNGLNLSTKYECLLKKPNNKLINVYDRISIKNLPGYYMSLSDQCRLATNNSNSYSCGSNHQQDQNCKDLKCIDGNSCYTAARTVFDGTYCGPNKYCYRTDCIDLNLTYGHRNRLIERLDIKNLNYIYSDLLRMKCPAGTSQEKRYFIHNHYKYESCNEILINGADVCKTKYSNELSNGKW